jgi:hypothetical protein
MRGQEMSRAGKIIQPYLFIPIAVNTARDLMLSQR